MAKTVRTAVACVIGSMVLLTAGRALSAVTVFTNDQARDCYMAAKFGDVHGDGADDCTAAMFGAMLDRHDHAGTLVNRGVIYMQHGRYAWARTDLDEAIGLDPKIGEAFVNRGAVLIAQRRYAEGVADIDLGLTLGSEEPEKAYFNRALADEALDNVGAAYADYLKASQLNPYWAAPKAELVRFTVHQP